jgi:hypothetical protein
MPAAEAAEIAVISLLLHFESAQAGSNHKEQSFRQICPGLDEHFRDGLPHPGYRSPEADAGGDSFQGDKRLAAFFYLNAVKPADGRLSEAAGKIAVIGSHENGIILFATAVRA